MSEDVSFDNKMMMIAIIAMRMVMDAPANSKVKDARRPSLLGLKIGGRSGPRFCNGVGGGVRGAATRTRNLEPHESSRYTFYRTSRKLNLFCE